MKLLIDVTKESDDQLEFLYTPAKEYSLNQKNDEKWLSKGIRDIRSVLGYSGELTPSKKNHLIILVGFEVERVLQLIESYEPAVVSLGISSADQSINADHFKINEKRYVNILNAYQNAKRFDFSAIDPDKTKEQLRKQIDLFPGHNVIIATLNTKISTIGAGLLAIEDPTIQLCYATANQYNIEGYSLPDDECYILKF
jgi:hypothetical protein